MTNQTTTLTAAINASLARCVPASDEALVSYVLSDLEREGLWCGTPRKEVADGLEWDDEQWAFMQAVEDAVHCRQRPLRTPYQSYRTMGWTSDADSCEHCEEVLLSETSYVEGSVGHYCSDACRCNEEGC